MSERLLLEKKGQASRGRVGNDGRPSDASDVRLEALPNLLARYIAAPTRRHWVGVKTILRYLMGTTDLGLFFPKKTI
jgi:hypothetical protein